MCYILESLVALVLTINSLHFWWALHFEQAHFNGWVLVNTITITKNQKDNLNCNFWRMIQRFYWYGHTIWRVASMKNFTFFIFNSFEISSENEWASGSSFIHTFSLMLFHICQTSAKLLGSRPPATTLYYSSKPRVFLYPVYFFVISLPNTQLKIIFPFHDPPSSWLPTCIKIKSRICVWQK